MAIRSILALLIALLAAACDRPSVSEAKAASAPAPASQPATRPIRVQRVPAFPVDGTYSVVRESETIEVRIATTSEVRVAELIKQSEMELSATYRGGQRACDEMLQIFRTGDNGKAFNGIAVVIRGAPDARKAELYCLGKRNYVEITDRLTKEATEMRGVATAFDPLVKVTYFLHDVSHTEDESDKLGVMMMASDLSFALRKDGENRKQPCMLLDLKELLVLDKVS